MRFLPASDRTPGIVGVTFHPTRADLPPIQGPMREPVGWTPVVFDDATFGASGLTHRERYLRMDNNGRHVAHVKLNTAKGENVAPGIPRDSSN